MTQPSRKRSGLGRGLASLIPTGPEDSNSASMGHRMGDAAADVVLGGAPQPSSVGARGRQKLKRGNSRESKKGVLWLLGAR